MWFKGKMSCEKKEKCKRKMLADKVYRIKRESALLGLYCSIIQNIKQESNEIKWVRLNIIFKAGDVVYECPFCCFYVIYYLYEVKTA